MKTLKLILLLSVLLSMDSAAQTTYTIKQENYETMLEKVFKCARGWTEDGPVEYENLGYNINCFCERGGYGYEEPGVYYRFGKDDEHNIHIYIRTRAADGQLPGTMFYVGAASDCWNPSGSGGRCYSTSGTLLYEGDYEDGTGKPLGTFPISYSSNKRFEIKWDGNNMYIGETVNGVRHGWGIYIWFNGDCLFGEWENGRKCGFGMKKLSNSCACISDENWNGENYVPGNME
ncbi:MAG: hypothetical protein J6T70_18295 [Bacteroidales bacterium]|nr:hypothetical protein [Bacteroidales bacterium]